MEKERAIISDSARGLNELLIIKGGFKNELAIDHKPVYPLLLHFLGKKALSSYLLKYPLDTKWKKLVKRFTDITLSAFFIIFILSWLVPLLAIAIKIDSKGPIFFLQKRNKRNGNIFTCIKFRSMKSNPDADTLPAAIYDSRITRLGKFLRRYYLDEVPQFLNVLWGDMSVIGPRPHMLYENTKYTELIEYYDYRHKVKPGITGLAQVLGFVGNTNNTQSMRDRVHLDLFYVRHWTVFLDFKILFNTLFRFF